MGEPPSIEVTITNLNDNVDKNFLADLISKCGPTEEQTIYYHPVTKRHLGIARCVFFDTRSAQVCIDKYNGKSVMGKVLNVFHDAFGEHCKQFVLDASGEKRLSTIPFQVNPMQMVPPLNVPGAPPMPTGHLPHGHMPPGHTPHGHTPHGHLSSGHLSSGHTPHGHTPHNHMPQGHMQPGHPMILPPVANSEYPPIDGSFIANDSYSHPYGGSASGFPHADGPHADGKGKFAIVFPKKKTFFFAPGRGNAKCLIDFVHCRA